MANQGHSRCNSPKTAICLSILSPYRLVTRPHCPNGAKFPVITTSWSILKVQIIGIDLKLAKSMESPIMFRNIIICLSCVAATLLSTAVFAADAVVADPGHYVVEFENDKVRIIRIKYGPGEKSVMHTHGPNVAVMLSEGTVRMTAPDGTSEDVHSEVGDAVWTDAQEHLPENLENKPLEVVLVELKD